MNSKFKTNSTEPFWNELFIVEESGNFSKLIKLIDNYYEQFFLFEDIQNELLEYKKYIFSLPTKVKQKNILKILNDIKNPEYLELIDWSGSEQDVVNMYVELTTSMIRNPLINSTKRYFLFKSLELNEIETEIVVDQLKIKTFENDYLQAQGFLELSKEIDNILAKHISINQTAQQLLLEAHLDNFPHEQKIKNHSAKSIINNACKYLNVEDFEV